MYNINSEISVCRILIGHEGPVWAIERKGDFLVSGSSDRTVSKLMVLPSFGPGGGGGEGLFEGTGSSLLRHVQ